jgi:hypothetical protein
MSLKYLKAIIINDLRDVIKDRGTRLGDIFDGWVTFENMK